MWDLFNPWKKDKLCPKLGEAYFITTGAYIGEMWFFCEDTENDYLFYSVTKSRVVSCPKDRYIHGLRERIIEKSPEKISPTVKKFIQEQYKYKKALDKQQSTREIQHGED